MSPTGKSQGKAIVLNLKYENQDNRTVSSLVLGARKAALVCCGMVFSGRSQPQPIGPSFQCPTRPKW